MFKIVNRLSAVRRTLAVAKARVSGRFGWIADIHPIAQSRNCLPSTNECAIVQNSAIGLIGGSAHVMLRQTSGAIALCIALALCPTGAAQAGWHYIGRTDAFVHYIDTDSIEKSGDITTVRELHDYLQSQVNLPGSATPYFSMVSAVRVYCDAMTIETLEVTAYQKHMGEGSVLFKDTFSPNETRVEKIARGTAGHSVHAAVCR